MSGEAITVEENNLAAIDYDKCTQCRLVLKNARQAPLHAGTAHCRGDETTVIELEPEKIWMKWEAIMQFDAGQERRICGGQQKKLKVLETKESVERNLKNSCLEEEQTENEKDESDLKLAAI